MSEPRVMIRAGVTPQRTTSGYQRAEESKLPRIEEPKEKTAMDSIKHMSIQFGLLVLLLCLDALWQDALRGAGSEFIMNLQNNSWEDGDADSFYTISSAFGELTVFIALGACTYLLADPDTGLRVLYLICMVHILSDWLKMIIIYPRPYWADSRIIGKDCESSFGMPAAHACRSVVGYLSLAGAAATYCRDNFNNVEGLVLRLLVWAAALYLIITIGLSRCYLGAHYPDQVVLGWFVALFVLIVFSEVARAMQRVHMRALRLRKAWALYMGVFTLVTTFSFFLYVALLDVTIDPLWEFYASVWCGTVEDPYVIDKRGMFTDSLSMTSLAIGLLLGRMWFLRRYPKNWFDVPMQYMALRFALVAIMMTGLFSLYYFVADPYDEDVLITSIVAMTTHGAAGLALTFFGPAIMYWLIDHRSLHGSSVLIVHEDTPSLQ